MFTRFLRNERGAPVVEYTVLLGLIGGLVITTAIQLGSDVTSGYSSTNSTLSNNVLSSITSSDPSETGNVSTNPPSVSAPVFPPDGESGGRFYESYLIVYQDAADLAMNNATSMPPANRPPFIGFLPYHEATAFGFVPGQAITTDEMTAFSAYASEPTVGIANIFAANNTAYTQCVQSNPDEFFGGFWGHDWDDVELTNRITGTIDGTDIDSTSFAQPLQYNTPEAIFGDDIDRSWADTPKPFNALWAYTCSRPIP